jgi:hypothetical protein
MSLYSERVAQDSPLFYFENNSSGVNNTGSITPSITTGSVTAFNSTGGVSNTACMVNAQRDGEYGFEYSNSATIFDDKVFSITGWYKVDSGDLNDSAQAIFKAGDSAGAGIYLQKTDKVYVYSAFGGKQVDTASITLTSNAWTHVALTMDASNIKLYINGTLVDSDTSPATLSIDSRVKYWMRASTNIKGAPGTFDEWAIFNTALSAQTISEHYALAFAVIHHAASSTASALAVQPSLSVDKVLASDPATASSLAGDTRVSNFNTPPMLRNYLASLSLEQWFEFESNIIKNSGSGGVYQATAFGRTGTVTEQIGNGPAGGNSLELGATAALGSMFANSSASPMLYTTEMSDNNFAYGIWFKFPTTLGTNTKSLITWDGPSGSATTIEIRNRKAYFSLSTHSNTYTYTGTADMNDNAWHLAVVRYNHAANTYFYYLDGSQVATGTTNGNRATPTSWSIAGGGTAGDTYRFNVADFFVGTYSGITGTEITNIWNAGQVPVQAGIGMADPIVRFNNSYNDYSETLTPTASFRFNSSGAPVNYGTEPDKWGMDIYGTNFTTGHPTKNNFAYRVLNKDTGFSGGAQMSSGQFSDNQLSVSVYGNFGTVTGSDNQIFALIGAFSSANIWINGASSGPQVIFGAAGGAGNWRIINSNDTSLFGGYHLYTATRSGSTGKFYVDGKLIGTSTTLLGTFTDSTSYTIGGYETAYLGAGSASVDKYVDEALIFDYTLSDQQVLELFQAITIDPMNATTGTFVNPAFSAGFGPTIAHSVYAVTASMGPVFPPINPATASAMFQVPNFAAIKNVNQTSDAMTASAQGENPGWNVGENNVVIHMNASAAMGDSRALIPGFWNASPAVSNAAMVEPTFTSTRGARINAQSFNANAFLPLAPAYYSVNDDTWYQKLLDVDFQSNQYAGVITFFNTSNSIYLAGGFGGWNAQNNRNAFNPYYGYNMYDTPLPVASAGIFDYQNRKALNIRNIALVYQDAETYSGGWTMETMIRTSKSNQFIAGGRFLGDTSNSLSRSKRTGIRLKDGKVAFTTVKDFTEGLLTSQDDIAFTGFKNIADGEWHHLIIQYRNSGVDQNTPRMQVWIDGQLDIQRFGYTSYSPNQIGFNSNDVDAYSDFDMSAISINKGSYVLEREILINYLAAINVVPVKAPFATATAGMGQGTKASGNRARALMLYFWPTAIEQLKGLYTYNGFTSTESPDELTTMDYFTAPPQEYEGWDVFPVDITGKWVSELVKPEAYGIENIGLTTLSRNVGPWDKADTKTVLVNGAGTFRNPVTSASRYIDLVNDIDLSQFDMIMFKNYPNDAIEKDEFTGAQVVDAYFNLRESKLFEDFVKSLRAAVDTGISLMVANAQLALDLKIVDRVETVVDMDDSGIFYEEGTDPYAPTQVVGTGAETLPVPPAYKAPLGWKDTWKNNRTRIVNTYPGITDYPALVKTQQAVWLSTDELRWGGPDRLFYKYEHKDTLSVGDEFVISTTGELADKNYNGYLATPFANVKAGKIITAFANTVRRGLDLIDNPYKNYAQSIVVSPGDVLDGTQVGGKIYVNFTEEINKCQETGSVELISDYWVNYAYDNGAITLAEKTSLLAASYNQNETPYWSLNGMHLLQQTGTQFELDTNFARAGVQKDAVKTRKVNKNGGISFREVPSGSVFFSSTYSWQYPLASFEVPSMPTRGFRWLSNREVLEGTIIRPTAMTAEAQIPNANAVPDRINNFRAQSMVAVALIEETRFSSGARIIPVLPATADATIVKPGSTIAAAPMRSNASMFADSRSSVASEDQVVLYLMHVDPILYIREDVIK